MGQTMRLLVISFLAIAFLESCASYAKVRSPKPANYNSLPSQKISKTLTEYLSA